MRRLYVSVLLILVAAFLVGCHEEVPAIVEVESSETLTSTVSHFSFVLPDGFLISDVTDRNCSIVNEDGVAVGGFILTDMTADELTDTESAALLVYLNSIAEGSEYFSWHGGDSEHPIRYAKHSVTDQDTQVRKQFYRTFFVKDSYVYDMWFDAESIDEDTVSTFYGIAEGK